MKIPNQPIYSIQEATHFIYDNISPELQATYHKEQIYLILIFIDDYYDLKGINVYEGQETAEPDSPIVVEEDELAEYICKQTLFHGIQISMNELKEILEAELKYCVKIGILKYPNL